MRRILLPLFLALLLAALAAFLAGRFIRPPEQETGPGMVKIVRPHTDGNEPGVQGETVPIPPGSDPVSAALTALVDTTKDPDKPHALPSGTRLLSVKVESGVATVDFSKEFNEVRGYGSTRESQAQNALRQTLAQFKDVERMLVLVEGKPFESEHADWTEPIAVRDENAKVGSGR